MPLKAVIVDDEPLNRGELKYLLSRHADIIVVGEAAHAAQALPLIVQEAPDFVLLDIQMRDAREGLTLAETLKKLPNPPAVIFVTAHPQHALAAYDYEPLHYLLKPVAEEKLAEALTRVRERNNSQWLASANYERMASSLRSIAPPNRRLTVDYRDKDRLGNTIYPTRFVQHDEILFIHKVKDTNTVEIHLNDGQLLQGVRRTLEQMEAELSDPRFFGVHNSYIVNLAHVCGLKKRFSDDEIPHLLLRECTAEIPVSKVRLAPLRDGLEKLFNASGDLKKMAIVNL